MIQSSDEAWSRIQEQEIPGATINVHGACIFEITHAGRYVRVVRAEEEKDGQFFLATYARDCFPKTEFYTEPWNPQLCSGEEILAFLKTM